MSEEKQVGIEKHIFNTSNQWPVGKVFTVSFTVEEENAADTFLEAMFMNKLIHGCSVNRVDFDDQSQNFHDTIEKLERIIEDVKMGKIGKDDASG